MSNMHDIVNESACLRAKILVQKKALLHAKWVVLLITIAADKAPDILSSVSSDEVGLPETSQLHP